MAITLYDAPRCPFCARTRIVLAEKGVLYNTVTIDLEDRPAWVIELNPPDGRVPILEEDGWLLPESVVIDEYLEERYPDPPLLPEDPGERATARLLVFRFDETLGDPYYAFRREQQGAERWLALGLRGLEAMLGTAPFLTGARFGLADVSYLPWLLRLRGLMGLSLEPYPAIAAWLEACSGRPSVAAEIETVASLAA
ncbi:MAG TPA: glutathione S-transferase family protein [Gaiella sp.]|jgi:glutathione S-transferase